MNYRVVWRKRSLSRVMEFLFLAMEQDADHQAIDRAYDEINRLLADDPLHVGESRDEGERVLIVEPLTVRYEVFPDQLAVVIYQVIYHRFPNRPG